MKIKELKTSYPLVYQAALNNQRLQGNKEDDELEIGNDRSQGNFNWNKTPEGDGFWRIINDEDFNNARKILPNLFNEFIVGRWYKYRDSYIKHKQVAHSLFVASEHIRANNYSNEEACFGDIRNAPKDNSYNAYKLLSDLSEIQKYLPDNHSDKISFIPKFKAGQRIKLINDLCFNIAVDSEAIVQKDSYIGTEHWNKGDEMVNIIWEHKVKKKSKADTSQQDGEYYASSFSLCHFQPDTDITIRNHAIASQAKLDDIITLIPQPVFKAPDKIILNHLTL